MLKMPIISVSVATALLLGACTTMDSLKRVKQKGTPFQQQLSLMYRDFAEAEAAKYDWIDSQHFIDKGMQAALGQEVAPELVEHWHIPKVMEGQLHEARHMLLTMLNQDRATTNFPVVAARAQTKFDCWLEEQEEDWQLEDIAACREGFYTALAELGEKLDRTTAVHPTHTAYQLLFDTNSASLDQNATALVEKIAAELASEEHYDIVLNGYTDRVGAEDYNLRLSMRRAVSVKDALVARGLKDKSITVFAFGEADAAVVTPDNIAEPKNRRVVVHLTDQ
jgi:OOP family OmpA-OmpF porin